MPAIKNTLLGLATVAAVASTSTDFHAVADLTKFDAKYDGMAMSMLTVFREIEIVVNAKKNESFTNQFDVYKYRLQNQAMDGVLTPQSYTCQLTAFYALANTVYPSFSGYVAKNVPTETTTEMYIKAAPTFWWDFLSDKLSTAATAVGNKDLKSLYTSLDAKVEADITNKSPSDTIMAKLDSFLKSANALVPTYSTKANDVWTKALSENAADFQKNAVCPNVTVTTSAPTPTSVKPSTTTTLPTLTPTATPSRTPTPTPPVTEVTVILIEFTTPSPTVTKANVTTTAPPAKSSGNKVALAIASTMVAVAVVALGSTL